MSLDIFSKHVLLESIDYLFQFMRINEDGNCKRFKVKRYYLPKRAIKNYKLIIIGKSFYDQAIIDVDINGLKINQKSNIRIR